MGMNGTELTERAGKVAEAVYEDLTRVLRGPAESIKTYAMKVSQLALLEQSYPPGSPQRTMYAHEFKSNVKLLAEANRLVIAEGHLAVAHMIFRVAAKAVLNV